MLSAERDSLAEQVKKLTRERDEALKRIENAAQAMAETQPSWEWRAHAVVQALGLNFGGPQPDLPDENSWYARNLRMAEQKYEDALIREADMKKVISSLTKTRKE